VQYSSLSTLNSSQQIKIIKVGDVIPAGFELLERTISNEMPGYMGDIGTIAIKRATTSDVMFVQGEPFVDDICFVLLCEGEEVPEGYVSLERHTPSSKGPPVLVDGKTLAFHQRPAMGLCDLAYESVTLDRYPEQVNGRAIVRYKGCAFYRCIIPVVVQS
jgi:hypothetical protein